MLTRIFWAFAIFLFGLGAFSQQIGVPWFPGWQGPFSGVTDYQGYFEIVVLRTGDANHAITGTLYDSTTRRAIANSPVTIWYYGGLALGTKVKITMSGYRTETAVIRYLASSSGKTSYKTYGVGTVYLTSGTGPRPPQIQQLAGVDFGDVPVGNTKTTAYRFVNTLGERITINAVGFGDRFYGQDPPPPTTAVFSVSGLVLPQTLPPGGRYSFRISFTPPGVGRYTATNPLTLCVTTHTTNRHIHFQIRLSGNGTSGGAQALTLYPIQDATIRQYFKWRSNNYGAEHDLLVAPEYSGMIHPGEDRTLIQFDLSRIPAGVQIRKATLKLCVWEFQGDYLLVAVYPINRSWHERTVTWETHQNAYDYQTMVTREKLSGLKGGDWVEFDVTSSVRNALTSGVPHYGWMLIPMGLGYSKVTEATFYSREGGEPVPGAFPGTILAKDRRPMLVIEYGSSTSVPIKDKTMCKDVQRTSPYDPITRTSTFTIADRKAIAWVKFGPVYKGHRVRFEWYWLDSPSGSARLIPPDFRDIPPPQQYGHMYWDWYVVWSEFRYGGTLFARLPKPSHWEVKIYVDGTYVDSLYFTIVD